MNERMECLALNRLITLSIALVLLASCASGVSVRSDISPTADFSQYRTYGFFSTLGIEGGYNSPIYGELFRKAISRQMEDRGYRLASDPDLLVNVTTRFDQQVRVTMYTAPYLSGAYYDQLGGAYYGSGAGVGMAAGTRTTRTEEASVFIDLVDNAADKISWQGVSVIKLDDKKAQKLEETIDYSVSKVFALYPYEAGQ